MEVNGIFLSQLLSVCGLEPFFKYYINWFKNNNFIIILSSCFVVMFISFTNLLSHFMLLKIKTLLQEGHSLFDCRSISTGNTAIPEREHRYTVKECYTRTGVRTRRTTAGRQFTHQRYILLLIIIIIITVTNSILYKIEESLVHQCFPSYQKTRTHFL